MVYVFLAEGFEETEAICPVDILRRAGLNVLTVAVADRDAESSSCDVTGSHGITVTADITAAELDLGETPELVVLPGGMPGAANLEKSAAVREWVLSAARSGAFVGAICAAPMVLGKLGLLEGKSAVCYPGFEKHLSGAKIVDAPVVRDGNIITARGMGAALDFGLALVAALRGDGAAEAIKKSVMAKE